MSLPHVTGTGPIRAPPPPSKTYENIKSNTNSQIKQKRANSGYHVFNKSCLKYLLETFLLKNHQAPTGASCFFLFYL